MIVVGWVVLAGATIAPLVGVGLAASDPTMTAIDELHTPPIWLLVARSIVLSLTATGGALLLGIVPAAVLGASRGRGFAVILGLCLAPLLIPPQVYAYAWGCVGGPAIGDEWSHWRNVLRGGLISAGWLWPVVALIVAAGWRSGGRGVYAMALMDTSTVPAFFKAVLPSLRPHLLASGCVVFAVTLLAHPIPHMTMARVFSYELMTLVDAGVPPGQILRMAGCVTVLIAAMIAPAYGAFRDVRQWQAEVPDEFIAIRRSIATAWLPVAAGLLVWLGTVALPMGLMWRELRSAAWIRGFRLFARDWWSSAGVSVAAGAAAVVLAVATVLWFQATGRRWLRWAWLPAGLTALVPPAALAIGFVAIFNRGVIVRNLYTDTPVVWILGLVGRFGAIAILITYLATGRRHCVLADQARADGAGSVEVLKSVLLPWAAPSLLAAGLIVAMLSLFEIVVTQIVGPVRYPSIAIALLNQMHYARVDEVITTSIVVMTVGVIMTQVCGWLLVRTRTESS
jgi:ABC-type Fe3+ transport system permease subunit